MGSISVVINTRNEEKNLPRALASTKGLAEEIVVVDMESSDKTWEIAKRAGAKVYLHKPTGYVEPARNFAISKATGDWVLILDADEEISKKLAQILKQIAGDSESVDFYRLPRKNIIFGKWIKHSRWWPDYNIRFFKKGKVAWGEIIHSVPETQGKGLDLKAIEDNAITHHNYESIEQFIDRLNNYTTQHAKLLIKDGYKFSWRDVIAKTTAEFISRYFAGEGYKDGLHGLALAKLQAFSELVLYLKVWQLERFKKVDINVTEAVHEMKTEGFQLHYWQADAMVKEGGGIIQRIKRKFKLP